MKLSLRPAVTLDGYIANLQGECYSWIVPEDEQRYELELRSVGCELVGHKTYEQYKDNYDARKDIITFVYTRSLEGKTDTANLKFVSGPLDGILRSIENEYGISEAIVSGGGSLNGALAKAGLIDELYISYHPIVLGEGIPLFGDYKPTFKLEFIGTNVDIKPVVRIHYRVVGHSGARA